MQTQGLEAEQAVIGSCILSQEAFDTAESILLGDEFYDSRNEVIFQVMREMREEDNPVPIDLVILTGRLVRNNLIEKAGGVSYLQEISSSVPTVNNVGYYAEMVAEFYRQRRGAEVAQALLKKAQEQGDSADFAASMAETAASLADRATKGNDFRRIDDVMREAYENVEKRFENRLEGGLTGIPSGFNDLDNMTSGFQRSDLIILAARPSVGKTALALNIAQHAGIRAKSTVAVFSCEMSAPQLGQRNISAEGNVDANRLRTGYLEGDDWEKVVMAVGSISSANIYIDDTPGIAVSDIRVKCRRLKKQAGLDIIIIDYLQLLTLRRRRENRQQEVSEISRTLKQIARELNVPVVALSQLSRGVEQRQDKRPMMSDLRESGSIEQDADIVAFLYRDDYYDKESAKKNIIEIIIAKHRNGPIGTVELAFLKQFNKFVGLDRAHG
jgi:replicative DNA helicase